MTALMKAALFFTSYTDNRSYSVKHLLAVLIDGILQVILSARGQKQKQAKSIV
jgi:hypothetical protein